MTDVPLCYVRGIEDLYVYHIFMDVRCPVYMRMNGHFVYVGGVVGHID